MRGSQPESMHRQGGSRMRTSHGQRRPVHDVTCMGRANRRRGTGPLPPPPRRPRPRHLPREPCNTQGGEREWGRGERPCGAERRRGVGGMLGIEFTCYSKNHHRLETACRHSAITAASRSTFNIRSCQGVWIFNRSMKCGMCVCVGEAGKRLRQTQ